MSVHFIWRKITWSWIVSTDVAIIRINLWESKMGLYVNYTLELEIVGGGKIIERRDSYKMWIYRLEIVEIELFCIFGQIRLNVNFNCQKLVV